MISYHQRLQEGRAKIKQFYWKQKDSGWLAGKMLYQVKYRNRLLRKIESSASERFAGAS